MQKTYEKAPPKTFTTEIVIYLTEEINTNLKT